MLSKIDIVGTGSDGNNYLLTFDDGWKIQLDAGVRTKNIEDINYCFITHNHSDHNHFMNKFLPEKVISPSKVERFTELYESFPIPHAVLNNAYIIKHDGEKILYLVDCGDQLEIKKKLKDITIALIEVNWDYFLCKYGIIKGQYQLDYSMSNEGHLSNLDTLNLIARLELPMNCKIVFIHKSKHHANYDTTYKMFDSLPNKTHIAKEGETGYVKSWKWI